jgi:hypothetical protein
MVKASAKTAAIDAVLNLCELDWRAPAKMWSTFIPLNRSGPSQPPGEMDALRNKMLRLEAHAIARPENSIMPKQNYSVC